MATATRKPPGEVHGSARLTLFINGDPYGLRPVASDWHAAAFALRKADGTVYHVAADEHGPQCDCPDATFRDRKCKHLGALAAVGLFPPAAEAGPCVG
jgi:hypothetical protein